jgi:hypothetical protein
MKWLRCSFFYKVDQTEMVTLFCSFLSLKNGTVISFLMFVIPGQFRLFQADYKKKIVCNDRDPELRVSIKLRDWVPKCIFFLKKKKEHSPLTCDTDSIENFSQCCYLSYKLTATRGKSYSIHSD